MYKKEEILKKSRNSNKDEGIEYVENKGRKIGFTAFCIVFIFIVLFNAFRGEESYAVSSLFWIFIATEAIPKYKFTHEKVYLVTIIAGGIASIASLISFILVSVR